jgi:hypothetical protein
MLEALVRAGTWPLDRAAVRTVFRTLFRVSLTLDVGVSPRAEEHGEGRSKLAEDRCHG